MRSVTGSRGLDATQIELVCTFSGSKCDPATRLELSVALGRWRAVGGVVSVGDGEEWPWKGKQRSHLKTKVCAKRRTICEGMNREEKRSPRRRILGSVGQQKSYLVCTCTRYANI